jgi:hypothetical protein
MNTSPQDSFTDFMNFCSALDARISESERRQAETQQLLDKYIENLKSWRGTEGRSADFAEHVIQRVTDIEAKLQAKADKDRMEQLSTDIRTLVQHLVMLSRTLEKL